MDMASYMGSISGAGGGAGGGTQQAFNTPGGVSGRSMSAGPGGRGGASTGGGGGAGKEVLTEEEKKNRNLKFEMFLQRQKANAKKKEDAIKLVSRCSLNLIIS